MPYKACFCFDVFLIHRGFYEIPENSSIGDKNKEGVIRQSFTLRLAILQQSYGRFGGAERLAFSHYVQLKRMGVDVTLFYEGRMSPGWRKRLANEPIRSIPSGIPRSPHRLKHLLDFIGQLKHFDKIIIHHHVEPFLAFYLSKLLGQRIIWYSGSVFELPWEEIITGVDYRRISPTVKRTGKEFYGKVISSLLLSNQLYGFTTTAARKVDIETVRGFGKVLANSIFLSKFLSHAFLPETSGWKAPLQPMSSS